MFYQPQLVSKYLQICDQSFSTESVYICKISVYQHRFRILNYHRRYASSLGAGVSDNDALAHGDHGRLVHTNGLSHNILEKVHSAFSPAESTPYSGVEDDHIHTSCNRYAACVTTYSDYGNS